MKWEIFWTERALKDAERLDRRVKERILSAIERLAEKGHGDVKQLTGKGGELRLRVGDWRVRFSFHHDTEMIEILRVLPRADAYRE